jgi:hypothetical protein
MISFIVGEIKNLLEKSLIEYSKQVGKRPEEVAIEVRGNENGGNADLKFFTLDQKNEKATTFPELFDEKKLSFIVRGLVKAKGIKLHEVCPKYINNFVKNTCSQEKMAISFPSFIIATSKTEQVRVVMFANGNIHKKFTVNAIIDNGRSETG